MNKEKMIELIREREADLFWLYSQVRAKTPKETKEIVELYSRWVSVFELCNALKIDVIPGNKVLSEGKKRRGY